LGDPQPRKVVKFHCLIDRGWAWDCQVSFFIFGLVDSLLLTLNGCRYQQQTGTTVGARLLFRYSIFQRLSYICIHKFSHNSLGALIIPVWQRILPQTEFAFQRQTPIVQPGFDRTDRHLQDIGDLLK